MSLYGRLWEQHREQRCSIAKALRELADAIERGAATEEVERLDRRVAFRRADLAHLEKEMEAL